jgi:hypothetical protein
MDYFEDDLAVSESLGDFREDAELRRELLDTLPLR